MRASALATAAAPRLRNRSPHDPWRLSPRSSERWRRPACESAPATGASNRAAARESESPSPRTGRADRLAAVPCRVFLGAIEPESRERFAVEEIADAVDARPVPDMFDQALLDPVREEVFDRRCDSAPGCSNACKVPLCTGRFWRVLTALADRSGGSDAIPGTAGIVRTATEETTMVTIVTFLLLAAPPAAPPARSLDLMALKPCSDKGRFQDTEYNPSPKQVEQLVAMGPEVIPFLISRLESTRRYEETPICFWPGMVEGDMALVILLDLFLDPTWRKTTLPESCWGSFAGPKTSPNEPGSAVFYAYVKRVGRKAIRKKWAHIWEEHRASIKWDEGGRFFRVGGRELTPCH